MQMMKWDHGQIWSPGPVGCIVFWEREHGGFRFGMCLHFVAILWSHHAQLPCLRLFALSPEELSLNPVLLPVPEWPVDVGLSPVPGSVVT